MLEQTLDVAIVLALYIPAIAFLVWVVEGLTELLARRVGRRETTPRPGRVRRGAAAFGSRVEGEPHLERFLLAGVVTPADLMTGAPLMAERPDLDLAA